MRLASKGRTAVRRVLALRPHCAHPILQTLPSGAQKRAEHRNVGRVFLPTASAFNGKREILAQQPMSCDASLWGTLPDGFEHAVPVGFTPGLSYSFEEGMLTISVRTGDE